jgi:hypothetical protein
MQGAQSSNFFDVYDDDGDIFRFMVGQVYDGTNGVTVVSADTFTVGTVNADDGWFAIFANSFTINVGQRSGQVGSFDNIQMWSWNASDVANTRIDCVTISKTANGDNIDASSASSARSALSSCAPTPPEVIPLPAAGWLLLAGVGGLAAMRGRKKAA